MEVVTEGLKFASLVAKQEYRFVGFMVPDSAAGKFVSSMVTNANNTTKNEDVLDSLYQKNKQAVYDLRDSCGDFCKALHDSINKQPSELKQQFQDVHQTQLKSVVPAIAGVMSNTMGFSDRSNDSLDQFGAKLRNLAGKEQRVTELKREFFNEGDRSPKASTNQPKENLNSCQFLLS